MNEVSLTVPAQPAFLHVVRTVVSGIAARQGLSYDAIDDLSLAASEAAGYLLGLPGTARRLSVGLKVEDMVSIRVMTDATVAHWPPSPGESLAWKILSALVSNVEFTLEEQCPAIQLIMHTNGTTNETFGNAGGSNGASS